MTAEDQDRADIAERLSRLSELDHALVSEEARRLRAGRVPGAVALEVACAAVCLDFELTDAVLRGPARWVPLPQARAVAYAVAMRLGTTPEALADHFNRAQTTVERAARRGMDGEAYRVVLDVSMARIEVLKGEQRRTT